MFDIGFPELLLVSVVTLLVLGPERLPEALRNLGLWLGRARRSFSRVKTEIEREIGMDEVRRQLHNEAIMEQMKGIEQDVHGISQDIRGGGGPASEGPTGEGSSGEGSSGEGSSREGPTRDESVEPDGPSEPAPELPPETPGPAAATAADER